LLHRIMVHQKGFHPAFLLEFCEQFW